MMISKNIYIIKSIITPQNGEGLLFAELKRHGEIYTNLRLYLKNTKGFSLKESDIIVVDYASYIIIDKIDMVEKVRDVKIQHDKKRNIFFFKIGSETERLLTFLPKGQTIEENEEYFITKLNDNEVRIHNPSITHEKWYANESSTDEIINQLDWDEFRGSSDSLNVYLDPDEKQHIEITEDNYYKIRKQPMCIYTGEEYDEEEEEEGVEYDEEEEEEWTDTNNNT